MALFNYECDEVKRKIEEVSPNYPQLITYTSEWLYFYDHEYTPGTPVDLEYQEVVVNPYGSVDNAIPYNYKSAILKGNSRVNLVNDVTSYEVGNYTSSLCKINVNRNLENETLTIIFNVTSLEIPDGADGIMRIGGGWSGTIRHKPTLGVNKVLYNYTEKSNNMLGVYSNTGAYNLGQRITISDVMVLEGDYTQEDIPYFEGMQSVQMPVLTTFDGGIHLKSDFETGSLYGTNGTNYDVPNRIRTKRTCPTNGGTKIIFEPNITLQRIVFYYNNSTFVSNSGNWSMYNEFEIPNDVNNFRIIFQASNIEQLPNNFHIMTNANKSNILSTPSDLELRGIGDVKDELDLITGELTQRIGEIVLDGSESWSKHGAYTTDECDVYWSSNGFIPSNGKKAICDKLSYSNTLTANTFRVNDKGGVFIGVSKGVNITNYLSQNTPKINYNLSQESIKTVDLTPINTPFEGTNHYQLTSNIPCEAILEVPVVSTGEQTLEEINND